MIQNSKTKWAFRSDCVVAVYKVKSEFWSSAKNPAWQTETVHISGIFTDTIWLRFGVCSYLHPGHIFHISNLVHSLFPNPVCLHLAECSAVLYCDSMAHERELPLFQLHGAVIKCYAPTQRQMYRFYSRGGIWWESSCACFIDVWTDCRLPFFPSLFQSAFFLFSVFILSCASLIYLSSSFISVGSINT